MMAMINELRLRIRIRRMRNSGADVHDRYR